MHQIHPPRRHSPPGGEFTTDCLSSTGDAIWANSHTSCPFAQNVLEQYELANLAGPQELVHFFVRVDFICALQWHPTQLVAGRRVQCPASNSMGRVVGPVIPVMAFQSAGPVRRGLGMRWVMTRRASVSSILARCAPRQ